MRTLIVRLLGLSALMLTSSLGFAGALTPATTFAGSYPDAFRYGQGTIGLMAKGQGTNTMYMLEVDPTTGNLPIEGSISATNPSVSNTAAAVPSQATYVGANQGGNLVGLTSTANGLKVDGSAVTQPVSGTFWQATQPVSAASLPLPTGAATAAKQPALGTAGTASTDVLTVQGIASMTPLKVDGSGVTQPVSGTFWQATQPVSAASLPLPSGAATSALQTQISGQLPTTLGAHVTSASVAVNIASDQTVPVSGTFWQATQPVSLATAPAPTGRTSALVYRNDNSSVNITTGAYVQVVASTAAAIDRLYVFDSSGSALKIATGAAGVEVDKLYIPPGGSGVPYELNIPAGTRVAVEALDVNATSGQLIITGLN